MQTLPPVFPDLAPGCGWLVGAGPGDPGMLTLLARYGSRQADVALCDALVSESVGKHGGQASGDIVNRSKDLT
ncbi:MAG: hypothetical protein ACTSW2_11065 [Alphaproteobacteria bacterium]